MPGSKTARITEDEIPPEKPRRGPGRPPVHDEAWSKVTVVLFDRQIGFLDSVAADIRAQKGTAVSRAQLIRALVDAAADAGIDLTTAKDKAEMRAMLKERLTGFR